MSRRTFHILATFSLLMPVVTAQADEPAKLGPNSDKEPMAEQFSLKQGARFLDRVSVDWTRQRKCGTCHTNYAHMMAGPTVEMRASAELVEVRTFFETRVAGWDNRATKPIADGEIVATAAALALNDAASTGTLHPRTRTALDRMWTIQRPDGAWNWFDCDLPPMEDDDYYGIALAAVAVGHAPGEYQSTEAARKGLDKVRGYLGQTPAPNLHHRALLLWASLKVDGLMDRAERERTVTDLLAKQRPDGGWSLTSLGKFTRRDGTPNPEDAPSDGYGTGFVIYVLRQAGMPAESKPIQQGIAWLKSHQRASGRWFTRSPTLDRVHYVTHAGTGYALMALAACGEK
ncbi:prenyltransferase/squalene oxidase repeat-containing protein [Singulisphaera sp. Ch08]|uniref:Prenyltransferase/squalene oxidase repeat-containing protein n=1 Tax=Singulisphaera sp. Ch08 TaxID=3120278 RepID=A0AAU7CFR0_9BACT